MPQWGTPDCSVVGVLKRPLLGLLDGCLLISFPSIGNLLIQGIIQVWERHQGLNWQQHRSNLKRGRPLVLQDIQADSTKLVDVRVVDLGSEKDLWWHHWVLIWQEKLAIENSTFIWSLGGASDLNKEMSWILLIWLGVDANDWVLRESLRFLQKDESWCQTKSISNFLTLRILGGIAISF